MDSILGILLRCLQLLHELQPCPAILLLRVDLARYQGVCDCPIRKKLLDSATFVTGQYRSERQTYEAQTTGFGRLFSMMSARPYSFSMREISLRSFLVSNWSACGLSRGMLSFALAGPAVVNLARVVPLRGAIFFCSYCGLNCPTDAI